MAGVDRSGNCLSKMVDFVLINDVFCIEMIFPAADEMPRVAAAGLGDDAPGGSSFGEPSGPPLPQRCRVAIRIAI